MYKNQDCITICEASNTMWHYLKMTIVSVQENQDIEFLVNLDDKDSSIIEKHMFEKHESDKIEIELKKNDIYIQHIYKSFFFVCILDKSDEAVAKKEQILVFAESLINIFSNSIKTASKLTLFETIFREIPITMTYKDTNEIYQMASKQVDVLYKKRFDTIVGKSIDEVYPNDQSGIVRELDQEAIQSKQSIRRVINVLTDEEYKTIDAHRLPIYNCDENLMGVVSVGFDITEQTKTAKELDYTNNFQKKLLQITESYKSKDVFDFDQNTNNALKVLGEMLQADRAYVFTYDFNKNTMSNSHEWCNTDIEPMIDELQDVLLSDFREVWVDRHLNNESVIYDNISLLNHSSPLYKILSMQDIKSIATVPIFINEGLFGLIGFDSVTNYQKWESKSNNILLIPKIYNSIFSQYTYEKNLKREMLKSEKANMAKSDFLAIMSHEIRTPISGINNVHHLLANTTLSVEQRELLEISKNSLNGLKSIVDNVLDYSVIEADKLVLDTSVIDIEEILLDIINNQKHIADEKKIDLNIEYDYAIETDLLGDEKKIRTILMNLINNGIKYTNSGDVTIRISLLNSDQYHEDLMFEIIDTGIGITKENIKHLFDMFYRVDSSTARMQQGTGIGLALAYKLILFLGGILKVEGTVNKGTKFYFSLPFRKSEKMIKYQGAPTTLLYHSEGYTHGYCSYVRSMGMDCTEVASSVALSKLDVAKFEYILINASSEFDSPEIVDLLVKASDKTVKIALAESTSGYLKTRNNSIYDFVFHMPISRSKFFDLTSKKVIVSTQSELLTMRQNKNILIVDDNTMNLQVFKMMLENNGFVVDAVENGFLAIEECNKKVYDIVFMDIQMPGIDGYETTRRIRKNSSFNAKSPIIAITATAIKKFVDEAYEAGCNSVISKPFEYDDVLAEINRFTPLIGVDVIEKTTDKQPVRSNTFDVERFEKSFNNKDVLMSILDTFVVDTQKRIIELQEAVEEKNILNMKTIVHYLKSSYGYVFAQDMLLITQELLDAYHKDDVTYFMNVIEDYFDYYDELLKSIETYGR